MRIRRSGRDSESSGMIGQRGFPILLFPESGKSIIQMV